MGHNLSHPNRPDRGAAPAPARRARARPFGQCRAAPPLTAARAGPLLSRLPLVILMEGPRTTRGRGRHANPGPGRRAHFSGRRFGAERLHMRWGHSRRRTAAIRNQGHANRVQQAIMAGHGADWAGRRAGGADTRHHVAVRRAAQRHAAAAAPRHLRPRSRSQGVAHCTSLDKKGSVRGGRAGGGRCVARRCPVGLHPPLRPLQRPPPRPQPLRPPEAEQKLSPNHTPPKWDVPGDRGADAGAGWQRVVSRPRAWLLLLSALPLLGGVAGAARLRRAASWRLSRRSTRLGVDRPPAWPRAGVRFPAGQAGGSARRPP